MQLIREEIEVRDLALRLWVSGKTVEAPRAHIKEKLERKNAHEVARFATIWVNQQR